VPHSRRFVGAYFSGHFSFCETTLSSLPRRALVSSRRLRANGSARTNSVLAYVLHELACRREHRHLDDMQVDVIGDTAIAFFNLALADARFRRPAGMGVAF
jgi:hypothetical protein